MLWDVTKGGGSTILRDGVDADAQRRHASLDGRFLGLEEMRRREGLPQRGGEATAHVGGGARHGGYFLWSQAVTADTGAAIVETTKSE